MGDGEDCWRVLGVTDFGVGGEGIFKGKGFTF